MMLNKNTSSLLAPQALNTNSSPKTVRAVPSPFSILDLNLFRLLNITLKMSTKFKTFSGRQLVDSSFIWPRIYKGINRGYNCLSGVSVLAGTLILLYDQNLVDDSLPRDVSYLVKKYIEESGMKFTPVIENHCRRQSDSDTIKGTVKVMSRSREEVPFYKVRIFDVVHKSASDERKKAALLNWNLHCTCDYLYQLGLAVPITEREKYNDRRRTDDIPSPSVQNVICAHAVAGYGKNVIDNGAEDYGLFGLQDHVLKIMEYDEIKNLLDKKVPVYKLNRYLRDELRLFSPLEGWV